MKFSIVAVLALVTPALSLSTYLESLTKPTTAASVPATSSPFFFTNGVRDEPVNTGSNYYFTNGPSDVTAAKSTASYMEALSSSTASRTPTGVGMMSYLDALKGPSSAAPRGAGITSYLDALPKSNNAPHGSGISSYAESLNRAGAASAPSSSASSTSAKTTESYSFDSPTSIVAASSVSYLSALSKGNNAPTGAGMTTYLDSIPKTSGAPTGAGMRSYADALRTVSGMSGPGIQTYIDALSGSKTSSSSFVNGKFDFSLEVDAAILEQLREAGNRRVTMSGKISSVRVS
jgi:hypothetical protein